MRVIDETQRCEKCDARIGFREGVHLGSGDGGERPLLCARCANLALAEVVGVDFDHPDFTPMMLQDADGMPHHFKFVTHLVPTGISIMAVEEGTECGYELQAHGELGDDTMTLFRELLDRMRRDLAILALASEHIGRVHVVVNLSERECRKQGIEAIDVDTNVLVAAGAKSGPLSFEDWLCLIVCRERAWSCLTNDRALRRVCRKA